MDIQEVIAAFMPATLIAEASVLLHHVQQRLRKSVHMNNNLLSDLRCSEIVSNELRFQGPNASRYDANVPFDMRMCDSAVTAKNVADISWV